MQSHKKITNSALIVQKLQSIDSGLLELSQTPAYSRVKEIVVDIVSLLGVRVPEKSRYSFLLDQKFRKNEGWFNWHAEVPDKRAGELLKHEEGFPLEIKIYWLQKLANDRIKGTVRFTDNYEDNERTRDEADTRVGLDFFITPKLDGVIIALSNSGFMRTLEIRGKLNNTHKQIFANWVEIGSGQMISERGYLHKSLWDSFELKVVNEAFYGMISQAFTDLKQHLEDNKIFGSEGAKQFSNRLIGRLLFVWFLRKKGFIFDEKTPYFETDNITDENYYSERLGKLFFETLNKPVEARNALHDDLKTPYLNGGLFYQHESDASNKAISFPKHFFAKLFMNLDEYNFTTDESTPDFEQVAIDPEMLGRVFENLLASMTEETGEQARKAKGAFYTPREIVQYMCRESIRRHLYTQLSSEEDRRDIDALIDTPDYEWVNNESNKTRDISRKNSFDKKIFDALESIKVLDPACGSGAYPVGMLHTLLRIYSRLNRTSNEYELKLKILENNIYGVDIDPMAVEISRLRSFLALIVDQEYNVKNKNGGIDILPNLEFKFVCANSLLNLNDDSSLYDGLHVKGKKQVDLEKELMVIKKRYFKVNWKEKLELERKLENLLSSGGLFESKKYAQLRTYHPFRQVRPAQFYQPTLMHDVEGGFNIVIGNPPYVSTKGVKAEEKVLLKKQYHFADDLYAHFYFKGVELCRDQGVLSYITSKTFWTIQTKKNVRELLLKNNLMIIYDTDNPFQSVMVDTCVIVVQKEIIQNNKIIFLKSDGDYSNPSAQEVEKAIYENAVNNVIFKPSQENLTVYNKYNNQVKALMDKWWVTINTSKNISKNATQLDIYRKGLKAGDITLLGLITDGGQGLATANNGKFVGVLATTKEATKVYETRIKKFFEFITKKKISKYGTNKEVVQSFLNKLSEIDLRNLFDSLKEKYGRDIFGKGFLYRIVDTSEVKDVSKMTEEEKQNGIRKGASFVPYDKGDKDGNRWYLRTPYYIDWNRENVDFLKQDPRARYQGDQFFFRSGFCWSDIHTVLIKTRLKEQSVHDVKSMSLFSFIPNCSDKYLVSLLNSTFISNYDFAFVNGTQTFQINDARQIPIIIPTKDQLMDFEDIFDRAYAIKTDQFDERISDAQAKQKLEGIQKELDMKVDQLYGLK